VPIFRWLPLFGMSVVFIGHVGFTLSKTQFEIKFCIDCATE